MRLENENGELLAYIEGKEQELVKLKEKLKL
jgi:hypothetical protein